MSDPIALTLTALGLNTCLFAAGLTLTLMRPHALLMILGAELMFMSAGFNFVLADSNHTGEGGVAALVILVVSTCETALALAVLSQVQNRYKTLRADELTHLKERLM